MARVMGKELAEYRDKIGEDEYRRQYHQLYTESKQHTQRYSGKKYTNSKEKLEAIKQKYKNGVTNDILNDFIRII